MNEPILNEGDYYCCPQCKEPLMQVEEGESIYANDPFGFDKIDTMYTASSLAQCPVCEFWFSMDMIHPMYWHRRIGGKFNVNINEQHNDE